MLLQITETLPAGNAASSVTDGSSHWMAHFFQQMLTKRRVRASTLEAYNYDIVLLSRWAANQQSTLLRLTDADLERYLSERSAQGVRPSTIMRQLSSWRRFYGFLVNQGVLSVSPAAAIRAVRVARHVPRHVPNEILGRLLQPYLIQNTSSVSDYRAQRDHALIWMLYSSGLSVSDVRLLLWSQVDESLRVMYVSARNGLACTVGLNAGSVKVFAALRIRAAAFGSEYGASPYCFPAASGWPLSRQALCHVVRKRVRDCGCEDVVTPSMIRHSGRMHLDRQRQRWLAPHNAEPDTGWITRGKAV